MLLKIGGGRAKNAVNEVCPSLVALMLQLAEEARQSLDILRYGCQEELLANKFQSSQAQTLQPDLIFEFREQGFHLLPLLLHLGELWRVDQLLQIVGLLYVLLCGFTACQPHAEFGSAHPDKVLFDRAMNAVDQERFGVAHMTLQALINTYSESPYAEKAKQVLQDTRISDCGETWCTPPLCTSILNEAWPQ